MGLPRGASFSWGYYDKKQILEESDVKKYSGEIIKILENRHISLKHEFAKIRNEKTCGMKKALGRLNLTLDGVHHRGIDDAKNIAKIFKQFPNHSWSLESYEMGK